MAVYNRDLLQINIMIRRLYRIVRDLMNTGVLLDETQRREQQYTFAADSSTDELIIIEDATPGDVLVMLEELISIAQALRLRRVRNWRNGVGRGTNYRYH